MKIRMKARFGAGMVLFCLMTTASPVLATEGYMPLGYGTVQRGQGGAGVAVAGQDAMTLSMNPAGIAGMGRSLSFGTELFAPQRGYDASGTAFIAPGSFDSGRPVFPVPNFGWTKPLANGATLGINVIGSGGMNTSFGNIVNGSPGCGGGIGVYCGGPTGVDISQLFVSIGYAKDESSFRWGVAPTLAVQAFEATGLGAFAAVPGLSVDPANMTNRGHDFSLGIGLRAGIQVDVSPAVTLGLSGQTKINMSKFDKYAGLFENGGDFDIPAQVTAGVAVKASPSLTVMAEYQKIFYSGVGAVSNPFFPAPLGSPGGPGFGWDDVDVVKLGMEWHQNDKMTWRAGYARSTNPVGPEDVTLGILAPGVMTNHYTFGGSYRPNASDSIDFALVYAPESTVTGPEVTPTTGLTPGSSIGLRMKQVELSIGWTRKF